MHRRIDAKSIRLQVELSLHYGIEHAELVAMDLDPEALAAPDVKVPAERVYAHLELVADRTAFEPYCVALARMHSLSTLGALGFALRSTPNARAAIACFHRFQHLSNTLAAFEMLEPGGPHASIVEHRYGSPRLGNLMATEVSLLVTVQIWRELLSKNITREASAPLPVNVYHVAVRRRDADLVPYRDFCGCDVSVGAERGSVTFDVALLDRALPTADADLAEYFAQVLAQQDQAAQARTPLVLDVRRHLSQHLAHEPPSVAATARALGMSTRTLQRRLRADGTAFADILDHVRADMAVAYLGNPNLTTAEVAYLLGYVEATSFYRAFRRWHQCTPEIFRSSYQSNT